MWTGLELSALAVAMGLVTKKVPLKCQTLDDSTGTITFNKMDDFNAKNLELKLEELTRARITDGGSSGESETKGAEEEEIFGSGMWGVDFQKLKYANENVISVSLYEEIVNPRTLFPIIHPYVLCETGSWVYVFEKWRDGVAVSRFRNKEKAIKSRGRWFAKGKAALRRMPRMVQSTSDVQMQTSDLLMWSMANGNFHQYQDNCHTFAANLCKKAKIEPGYNRVEGLFYKQY